MDMPLETDFLNIARKTGVEIVEKDGLTIWQGPVSGKKKPQGPLAGKRIGVIVASEFSDFQTYYLSLYLTEFGAEVDFLGVDWVKWKNTRPTLADKGVQGLWGLSVDPIPTMPRGRQGYRPFRQAKQEYYDGLLVLGGHSADIIQTETEVAEFLSSAYTRGAVLGAIGEGSLPLINAGIISGKKCTGNRVVSFMLERIASFQDVPIASDQRIVTARDTVDTPAFLRELCRSFDSSFQQEREGILKGKRILIIAGEDFEDVELVAPLLEYIYRGAEVTVATFPPPLRARPPLLGLDVVIGNFGVSVPLQEVPESCYRLKRLSEIKMNEFDLVQIPGAFCPWNMVAAAEPIKFLKQAYDSGKYIAPICHGAIPVAAADLVQGKHLAGVGACKDAVTIMGGTHSGDWSAVVDGRIVSGRVPVDVPEFLDAITLALLKSR
jgi:protease I